MKADKSNPEKDRRIGRILMFITFWTSIILFRAFYCIFMVCLRLTVIRLTYWKSKKSFWQSITVTLHQTKKCKNKLLMGELSLSFNFTRFVCSNAIRACIRITRRHILYRKDFILNIYPWGWQQILSNTNNMWYFLC